MVNLLHGLALGLHLAAGVVLVRALARGRLAAGPGMMAVTLGAVAVHASAAAAYTGVFGELPLVGLGPSLSTLGLLIGIFLLLSAALRETRPLGLLLTPLIAVLLGLALAAGLEPTGQATSWRGLWFSLHILCGFVAFAGLAVAGAAGTMYLLQFRELKGKHFGRMFHFFPSLETLDRWSLRGLRVGFAGVTLALVIGSAWLVRFGRSIAVAEWEIVWGFLTWLVIVAALAARMGRGAIERRGAVAAVVGFLVVVVAYLVLRISLVEGRVFL